MSYVHFATPTSKNLLKVNLQRFPYYFGHYSSRINRLYNEDPYSISLLRIQEENKLRKVLNINVFDGHGGDQCVSLLAENLHADLQACVPSKEHFIDVLKQYKDKIGGGYWSHIWKTRDKYYDNYIASCHTKKNAKHMVEIIDKQGNIIDRTALLDETDRLRLFQTYLEFDLANRDKFEYSGSTSTSVFLETYGNEGVRSSDKYEEMSLNPDTFFINYDGMLKLSVAQVGDTKAILCDKDGNANSLNGVHHPDSPLEANRLSRYALGFNSDSFGENRFLNYANTRSFGDFPAKDKGVCAEPEIYSYLIGSTANLPRSEKSKMQFGGDECFIALVTDGISTYLSDQEIVDLITSTVNNRGIKRATPQYVCDEVIKFIMAIDGNDNATICVLRLNNWGNWPTVDRTGALREEKLAQADDKLGDGMRDRG